MPGVREKGAGVMKGVDIMLSIHQRILPYYARGWGTNQICGATGIKQDAVRIAARELGRVNPQAYSHHMASRTYPNSPIIYPNARIVISETERFNEV